MSDMTMAGEFISDDQYERFTIKWGFWAVLKLCADPTVKSVLDIGSGAGEHARLMRFFGKEVFTNDWKTDCDYPGSILDHDFGRQFDAVLCSHVLEHQRNVGAFLDKVISLVKEDGVISIAVPAHTQHTFITGHLTAWSLRLLAYNLMQAGLDCSKAQGLFDNECTFIVRKKMIDYSRHIEKSWGEYNKQSGSAHSEETTIPWHDDTEIIAGYLPFTSGAAETAETHRMQWDDDFTLPVPVMHKDILIRTNKQEAPVTLRYDDIKAKAEHAQNS